MTQKFLLINYMLVFMVSSLLTNTNGQNNGDFSIHLSKKINHLLPPTQDIIILDAAYYTSEEIQSLQAHGKKIFSYLNIGSIETFRSYYDTFKDLSIMPYENWPDEYWIDINDMRWQTFLIQQQAHHLIEKGIDGFFLDNIDIYTVIPTDSTFNNLKKMISSLKATYKKPIIINGGYGFIEQLLKEQSELSTLFDGVCFESVYTKINDYDHHIFGTRSNNYFFNTFMFLYHLKQHSLDVYIIEYANEQSKMNKISILYRLIGFNYYISNNTIL